MTLAEMGEIARRANHAVEGSRRIHPRLSASSSRAELIAWLVTCDPNGIYRDSQRENEDYDPLTLETAWEAVADLANDD